jgi:predicted permease
MAKQLVDALVPDLRWPASCFPGRPARIGLAMPVRQQQVRDITLISAIPGGFFGIVFGKSFNTIPEVASSGLIATYGLAIVTLPLWIFLLSRFM